MLSSNIFLGLYLEINCHANYNYKTYHIKSKQHKAAHRIWNMTMSAISKIHRWFICEVERDANAKEGRWN